MFLLLSDALLALWSFVGRVLLWLVPWPGRISGTAVALSRMYFPEARVAARGTATGQVRAAGRWYAVFFGVAWGLRLVAMFAVCLWLADRLAPTLTAHPPTTTAATPSGV